MADNDQNNDEYQFTELDSLGNEPMDTDEAAYQSASSNATTGKKDIKRNALIVLGVLLILYILYKVLGSWYSKKPTVPDPGITPVVQTTPQPVVVTPTVVEQPKVQQVISENDPDLKQKVSAIELAQQSVKSQVNSLGDNMNAVNNNINNLNTQISKLNQLVETLATQFEKQSEELNALRVRAAPKKVYRAPRHSAPRVVYYIQAVIPGRAWLIGSNGSTLTVREGTQVPGYGVVKLIDSMQGRVLMSSGQVIRFSQADS